jgi:hypothetical protein
MAESYSCPTILSDPQAVESGASGVWQMVDPAATPGSGMLMAVEVFDGLPVKQFQLAPEVTATQDGNADRYDLAEIEQAFIRCRYDGVAQQFVLPAEPSLSSCRVLSKDDVFQAEIVCE